MTTTMGEKRTSKDSASKREMIDKWTQLGRRAQSALDKQKGQTNQFGAVAVAHHANTSDQQSC